jgi:hypothetical protein
MGEMSPQEVRTARAAIRFANTRRQSYGHPTIGEILAYHAGAKNAEGDGVMVPKELIEYAKCAAIYYGRREVFAENIAGLNAHIAFDALLEALQPYVKGENND